MPRKSKLVWESGRVVKALCLGHPQGNLDSRSGKPRRFESCGSQFFFCSLRFYIRCNMHNGNAVRGNP